MLDILLLIVSAAIIVLTLLQSEKGDGLSAAFMGTKAINLFSERKERGTEKLVTDATMIAGILFFLLVVLVREFG